MKKRKLRFSTILFLLLLLVGLGILLYPTLNDKYIRWQLKQEIKQYNQVAEAEEENYDELWQAAEEYNRYLLKKEAQFTMSDEELERVQNLLNPLGTGMMGYIDIPKINVHLPIYQGIEEKELQSGAGYWMGSSLPTGGKSTHCVLTAHTGLVKAKMFTDIDQLETGDLFALNVLNRKLTYEVDQVLVTEPEEMSELYIKDGKDYVTLYTCTPYGVNTHRLLVRGHRVDNPEPADLGGSALRTAIIIAVSCVAALILLLLVGRWVRRKVKNPHTRISVGGKRKSRKRG